MYLSFSKFVGLNHGGGGHTWVSKLRPLLKLTLYSHRYHQL